MSSSWRGFVEEVGGRKRGTPPVDLLGLSETSIIKEPKSEDRALSNSLDRDYKLTMGAVKDKQVGKGFLVRCEPGKFKKEYQTE